MSVSRLHIIVSVSFQCMNSGRHRLSEQRRSLTRPTSQTSVKGFPRTDMEIEATELGSRGDEHQGYAGTEAMQSEEQLIHRLRDNWGATCKGMGFVVSFHV